MQLHIKVARALRAPLRQVAESGRLSLIDEVSDVLKTLKPAMCALISEYRLSPIEQSTGMWDPTGTSTLLCFSDWKTESASCAPSLWRPKSAASFTKFSNNSEQPCRAHQGHEVIIRHSSRPTRAAI